MQQAIPLLDSEFERIRKLVYSEARIKLGDNKRELVKSRLQGRLRKTAFGSYGAYVDFITKTGAGQEELIHFLDALSTNKTDFFREREHFHFLLQEILPEIVQRKGRGVAQRLRLWSAACSSGEEPYSMAITVREGLQRADRRWDTKILATDINTQMLETGRRGIYAAPAVEPVSKLLRQKYFTRSYGSEPMQYAVKPTLRELVAFRRLNLCGEAFPFQRRFNVIFCRNVMIYFDRPTRAQLVSRFYELLEPDGYLFIGHSESLAGMDVPFRSVRSAVYRRVK